MRVEARDMGLLANLGKLDIVYVVVDEKGEIVREATEREREEYAETNS